MSEQGTPPWTESAEGSYGPPAGDGSPTPQAGGPLEAAAPSGQPEPGPGAPWSARNAGIGLLVALLVTNLAPVLAVPFTGTEGLDFTLVAQTWLGITLFGVAYGYARAYAPEAPLRALGLRRFELDGLWLAIGAFVAYVFAAGIYTQLVGQPEQDNALETLGFEVSTAGAIVAVALIAVVAPITEELFFRGFFFAGLRRRYPFVVAALISGLLFGAIHLVSGNLAVVPVLFALGVLLAWLYEETGSLWPAIIVHGVNNSIAVALLAATM